MNLNLKSQIKLERIDLYVLGQFVLPFLSATGIVTGVWLGIDRFKEIAKIVNNKTFIFNKECKENGELYGSIKPKEITNLIKEDVKAEVAPSQIILKDELNKLGIYKANINFHSEVKANISIKIDKIQSK